MKKKYHEEEFMVDRDIIFAKVSSIQRCLKRIKDVTKGDPEAIEDLNVEEIVILNLQRAIQSAVDLAAHIVADEGWGMPRELRENFDLISKYKVLDKELTTRLRKMVGFRNIAVHEYESINKEILKSILRYNLKDLEEFYMSVLRFYDINEK
ncbi:MAG: DUF86 domain-containing protein [Candidatus Paceibacterota bacterium]